MEAAASALQRDVSALAVVARLVVDPAVRRVGIGRALLQVAADAARQRGLHLILDVATRCHGAIALYGDSGWRNVGEVTMVFRDGTELRSYVFVAPAE